MSEERVSVTLKIEADGPGRPGPVQTFRLVRVERHLGRRSERENWREDYAAQQREVIASGITRGMLADLVGNAADWLSYVETEGA